MSALLRIAPLWAVVLAGAAGCESPEPRDGLREKLGDTYSASPLVQATPTQSGALSAEPVSRVKRWNAIALDTTGLDHTPPGPGDTRVFGEQYGPGRSSRAMAIVHVAVFEAINAVTGKYRSYAGVPKDTSGSNLNAAVAQAAHDTLVALFPTQQPRLDELVAQDLASISDGPPKSRGVDLGRRSALAILTMRAGDGSEHVEPRVGEDYLPDDAPGVWRQDPVSNGPLALGAHWGTVRPFVMQSASQFRVPAPPAMSSPEYLQAYDEVKSLGGDGQTTPTARTQDQTMAGLFWAYDGMPSLCAPTRLYNQVVRTVAAQMSTNDATALARLLALVNIAMADAAIAVWESKYYYRVWRPVAGIRESDPGTGPTGIGDGNPSTEGDREFTPLGAPASNLHGPNFTPPFPSYPSGHAGFGAAVFQILRKAYGTDAVAFTLVSDELNGVTLGNDGLPRPYHPRSFPSLSAAEEENGQSRIYLGIHWAFDKTAGIAQGKLVGDQVFARVMTPTPKK